MRTLLLSILLTLPVVAQQPKPTPIPQIKCYPIKSNGEIVGWNCVDLPPECAKPRPHKREGGQR